MAKPRTKAELEKELGRLQAELSKTKRLLEGDDVAGRLATEVEQLTDELAALRDAYNELRDKYKAQQADGPPQGDPPAAAEYVPPEAPSDCVAADMVCLRRPSKLGKHLAPRGTVLATVYYHHVECDLNYLVAAVRNDNAKGEPLELDDAGEDD